LNIKIVYNSNSFKDILPIFATKEFLETKSSNFGWFINNDFILPFYIDKRSIFSKLVFTSQSIVLNPNSNEKDFLNEVVKKSKDLRVDYISQPLANSLFQSTPINSKYIEWGSYIVYLSKSEDEILKNMHSKHRNVIRKAKKDGVVIKETQDTQVVFNNIKETMLRQNRAYPSIMELEKIKPFSKFYIAVKDDVIQGSAILPYNKYGAIYLYGGSISRPYTGSLNFMHYQAMCDLKKEGVKQYDFMGARPNVEKNSKLEGIQRFKSRFGGELQKGYLWKYELNPFKVKLIYLLQTIKAKMNNREYLGDAIDQERKKKL
jgi:lipid II:glycine glycyltransferase (peptidoglycan interpeptide bridge formation enzyme)